MLFRPLESPMMRTVLVVIAIVLILNAVSERIGVPIGLEAIAVILVVDRLLDMCRTAVNVFGDSCGAVIIAKTEGEKGILEG